MDKVAVAPLALGVITRVALLLAIACFLLGGAARAADAPLLGHDIDIRDATVKASAILAGQIIKLDPSDANTSGGQLHATVKFLSGDHSQVSRPPPTADGLLHGAHIASGDYTYSIFIPTDVAQPVVGTSYIFWVMGNAKRGDKDYAVFKMIPGTTENIVAEKRLVHAIEHGK
jgi:hypothetical protein